jgi:uncharacterized protein (DUF885 family)
MKQFFGAAFLFISCFTACNNAATKSDTTSNDSAAINRMFANYWEDRMKLYPLEATSNGDNRYNDILQNDISAPFIAEAKKFYTRYADSITTFKRESLNENDRISYDIFKREMAIQLESFQFHDELMPMNQFWGLHLTFGQLGSGEGNQPFKTVKDYDNFLGRINGFTVWVDTAIANMRKGMNEGYVLPKALTVKVIPQLKSFVTADAKKNLFYGPVNKLPDSFSAADISRITQAYTNAINTQIVPAFKKLTDFFEKEYLPKSRSSSGIDSIPNGKETL